MRRSAAFLLALPLLAAPSFTIEQVLSSAFPSELIASPKADTVAWVMNANGVRNIWVARAPEFKAAPVTKFTMDDGQEIEDLAWTPDQSAIFFTRGGGPNGRGEIPNPLHDPEGARQAIWMAPVSGSGPEEIGNGHSPALSPDGAFAAWVASGQIWLKALAGSGAAQQIHARGSANELAWSHDGSRLAFTSDRGDHNLIGIYNTREKSLTYIDPSADRDRDPVWSPDSNQIAFIRIPASHEASSWGSKAAGEPWSIRVADPRTGKGHQIWRAENGVGSVFREMNSRYQLLWASGDRIVFPWERDGWLHLYSLPARGGAAKLLTPGAFEIEDATLTPDRDSIVFSSNQDDIDRRHIWRADPASGPPHRLTRGNGIEWSPAPTSYGNIVLLHSDARMPARPALLDDGGRLRDLAPAAIPADFPSAEIGEPQSVVFPAADGLRIHGQLFLPRDAGARRHPAVVFFHGGARRQMLPGWHYMFYYHQAYGFNQYLANKGYVVLSVNYRAGIGYGMEFREADHYGATGASEFNDVLGAGRYLRSRDDVDPVRIGLWGGSYGGYLTALGLARASDLFAVGVDIHGVHDWNLEIANTALPNEPEKRQETARIAFESSPLAHVATWRSPVLLIQGDDDRNVAFANSTRMVEALRKQGVYFEQLILPDEIHDFLVHADWLAVYRAADEFLGRFLKP